MPPEIDNSKPRTEALPLIDFYSFNQGSINMSEKSPAQPANREKSGVLEICDPFVFNQGLSFVGKGATADRAAATASDNRNASGATGQVPFDFHQGDRTPGTMPAPFIPQVDFRPSAPEVKPPVPGDLTPRPQDRTRDIPSPSIPGASGKSPIVEAYERRQGARHAGLNPLPAIDPIPGPSDLVPPSPGPRPDLIPPSPGPRPNDWTPPSPGPGPGPAPDLPPWTPPKPDLNPRPDVAPWTPPRPDVRPDLRPDVRPDRTDLISKLEPKYETSDIATAVKMARDTGLPLAVHIGASWCGYCVQMEQDTWPLVEGTNNRRGSMQGKVVVLHMDVDQARYLQGEGKQYANEVLKNRGGSVPLLRVFKVDQSGQFTKTAENHGAINSRSSLEAFLERGGVQR
jgi:thiol-disulfide isomerase/thioredoxin